MADELQPGSVAEVRHLLDFCLSPGGENRDKVEAIKRLNRCDVPDWDEWDEPSQLVLRRILDAVETPQLVADWKGYRFLGSVMAKYPDKIENIHLGVLLAIGKVPTAARTCYYGKMYEVAWDRSSGVGRRELRARCVEDLVRRMMGLARDDDGYALGELNSRLFILVDTFLQKSARCPEVAKMMSEVMDDFMWQHLEAPSPVWRCNAADTLFLAHPLEDPRMGLQGRREHLLLQHKAMLALLEDAYHTVRYVAVRGVCVALSKYWHVIAEDVRGKLLKSVFSERPYDGDWRVRQQVFRCARKLLARAEAASALEGLLPELRDCFHDVNGGVRLAFVELLQAVKEAGAFPFFYAVPLDHVVARLQEETVEPNVHSLVRLLLPYFCPVEEDQNSLFKRIFSLYRMNVEALWKLFFYSETVLLRQEAFKVISCILNAIHESVRRSRRSRSSSRGRRSSRGRGRAQGSAKSRRSRRAPPPAELMKPSDPEGAAALLQVVGVLWKTRVERSSGEGRDPAAAAAEEEVADLRATLQRVMPVLHDAFADTEAHSSLEVLSGTCQAAEGASALAEAMRAVRSATEDNAAATIAAHLDTIMNQNGVAALVGLLARSVTSAWTRVPGNAGGLLPSMVALIMMEVMLNTTSTCTALVERHYEDLEGLAVMLKNFQTLVSTRLCLGSPLTERRRSLTLTDDLLERGFELHLRLVACRGVAAPAQAKAHAIAQCVETLNWAERFLVPRLSEAVAARAPGQAGQGTVAEPPEKPLVVRVLRGVLGLAGTMVSSRFFDGPFLASSVEFCQLLMEPAVRCHDYFHALIVDLVVSALDAFRTKDGEEVFEGRDDVMKNHIFPVVCGLLDMLPEVCSADALDADRKSEAVVVTASAAYQTLLACELYFSRSPELRSGIIAAMAWNVMELVYMEVVERAGDVLQRGDVVPFSCGYLVTPLQETAPRLAALVQSLLDWRGRDASDSLKSFALEMVLQGLASGPSASRRKCKKLIQDAIKEISRKKQVVKEKLDRNSNRLDWSSLEI